MKKILAAVSAALILLSGCSVPAGSKELDYGSFGDYRSALMYEVRTEDGDVTEQTYALFAPDDEEKTSPVGKKDVSYDPESGDMVKYSVTIGLDDIEELVTYGVDDTGGEFYSEMYFDGDYVTREVWENRYNDRETGEEIREVGERTYYPGTKDYKTVREEVYRDGELVSEVNEEK